MKDNYAVYKVIVENMINKLNTVGIFVRYCTKTCDMWKRETIPIVSKRNMETANGVVRGREKA